MKLLLNSFVKGLPWSYPAWVWKAKEASAIWVISRVFFMGVSGISRLIGQEKQMYSRGSRYFKIPPADGESDSALAELLSGDTLVHQSSLPDLGGCCLYSFFLSPVPQGAHWLIRKQVRGSSVPEPYQHTLKSLFVRCPLFRCGESPCILNAES